MASAAGGSADAVGPVTTVNAGAPSSHPEELGEEQARLLVSELGLVDGLLDLELEQVEARQVVRRDLARLPAACGPAPPRRGARSASRRP